MKHSSMEHLYKNLKHFFFIVSVISGRYVLYAMKMYD